MKNISQLSRKKHATRISACEDWVEISNRTFLLPSIPAPMHPDFGESPMQLVHRPGRHRVKDIGRFRGGGRQRVGSTL
jgi:hypothetical protein